MKEPLEMVNQSEEEKLRSVKEIVRFIVRYKLGPNNEDWKDVVNDVLLAALMSLREGRFNPELGTSFRTYVLGITYNKVNAYFKRAKRQIGVQQAWFHSQNALFNNEPSHLEREEYREELKLILEPLPDHYSVVLYLRFFEDISIEEISQELGISPQRVSERIYYGLKLLRKKYKKENFFSIFALILTILIEEDLL